MANKYSYKKGQALAIVLMIIALTATIAGTAAFRTVSQTKQTKETEEQQKASNAAQGIIEKVLNDENVDTTQDFGGSVGSFNANVSPVVTQAISKNGSDGFVTKSIPKDSQYIFYLQQYDFKNNGFISGTKVNLANLKVYYQAAGCPVLEFILINDSGQVAQRKMSADCGANVISCPPTPEATLCNNQLADTGSRNFVVDGSSVTFGKSTTINTNNNKLLIVRPLFGATRLAFYLSSGNLPPQGEIITSQAQSGGGAQSTESVTREYPQIPDFLFATSF